MPTHAYTFLTLTDLRLGLRSLLESRAELGTQSNTAKTYLAKLEAQYKAIEALPEATEGKPLAEQLAELDQTHDGYGAAIYYLVEAYLRAPSTNKALQEQLLQVRSALVPQLGILNASYADEAIAAQEHQQRLTTLRPVLEAIPLVGDKTLVKWAEGYVKAGIALGETLRQRASMKPAARTEAGQLRGKTLGLLNRFRQSLADEFEDDASTLASIDRTCFAFFDQLEEQRKRTASAESETPKPAPTPDENKG